MANPNETLERGVKKLKDQGYTVTTYGRADSTKRYRKYHYEVNRRYKASRKELEKLGAGACSCDELVDRWKKRQGLKTKTLST